MCKCIKWVCIYLNVIMWFKIFFFYKDFQVLSYLIDYFNYLERYQNVVLIIDMLVVYVMVIIIYYFIIYYICLCIYILILWEKIIKV